MEAFTDALPLIMRADERIPDRIGPGVGPREIDRWFAEAQLALQEVRARLALCSADDDPHDDGDGERHQAAVDRYITALRAIRAHRRAAPPDARFG
jgi:hypothetical protein